MDNFYSGYSEDTADRLQRMQAYTQFALKNGDTIYMNKPYELTIVISKRKKEGKGE